MHIDKKSIHRYLNAFYKIKSRVKAYKITIGELKNKLKYLEAEIRYLQKHQDFYDIYYSNSNPSNDPFVFKDTDEDVVTPTVRHCEYKTLYQRRPK